MQKTNLLKIVGVGATVLGGIATIVSSLITKQQQDAKITEEVAKAVAEAMKGES